MGNIIVKIRPDEDQYVIWSSEAEMPLWLGTAAELLNELGNVDGVCPTCHTRIAGPETTQARIARADKYGSSSYTRSWWWERDGEPYEDIYAQIGLVSRENLQAIAELLADGAPIDDERIRILLTPLEDEEEL